MVTKHPDLWRFYLKKEIQNAADIWDGKRFHEVLFSEGTSNVILLDPPPGVENYLKLRVTGRCSDGFGTFEYVLDPKELNYEEAEKLLTLISAKYVKNREANRQKVDRARKILGLPEGIVK